MYLSKKTNEDSRLAAGFFNKNCMYVSMTRCFNVHIHSGLIATVELTDRPSLHTTAIFVQEDKVYSPLKFQVYNAVL
jgi:hypothetical protein